jgi:hypothetical protein
MLRGCKVEARLKGKAEIVTIVQALRHISILQGRHLIQIASIGGRDDGPGSGLRFFEIGRPETILQTRSTWANFEKS